MISNVKCFLKTWFLKKKFLYEAGFWFENFITCQIFIWGKYNASDFDLKNLQRVRFSINLLNTRQILKWIIYNVSDIECTSSAVCQVFMCSSKQSLKW